LNILIIEDDQNKIKQIIEFICDNLVKVIITKKFSYQSGLKEIVNVKYDLIILDMSMPTFDITSSENGGRPKPFAGREILRQMKRRDINTPVIVVTQFERFGELSNTITLPELRDDLQTKFKDIYLGTVYYNPALNSWRDEFSNLLKRIETRCKND
jgi:DNA-binding NarL/FixJ family response regulator